MANFLKECDTSNKKVVVLTSNEFPFNHVNPQQNKGKLENVKRQLAGGNISFISKICKQTSTNVTPRTIYPQKGNPHPSLLKVQQHKSPVPKNHGIGTTPNKKNKEKLLPRENELGKKKPTDPSKVTKPTARAHPDKKFSIANDETIAADNLSQERVIELINQKYGAALEAQLFLFERNNPKHDATAPLHANATAPLRTNATPKMPDAKIVEDSIPKRRPGINEYKQREEKIVEQIDKEKDLKDDIKEAEKHLKSILILDSPDDGYKLFTKEELKSLPDKIFQSPVKSTVKQETDLPVEVSSSGVGGNKLVMKREEDYEKKIWEFEPKDINFDMLIAGTDADCQTTSCSGSGKHAKEVLIANEDAVIFEEMDKFIKEINVGNGKNLNHNYCLLPNEFQKECAGQIRSNADVLQKEEQAEPGILSENKIDDKTGTLKEEETRKGEDGIKIEGKSWKFAKVSVNIPWFNDIPKIHKKPKKNIKISQSEMKKCDVLEKLVLESEIKVHQTEEAQATSSFLEKCQIPNLKETILETEAPKFADKNGEVTTFQKTKPSYEPKHNIDTKFETSSTYKVSENPIHSNESEMHKYTEKTNFIDDSLQFLKDLSKDLIGSEVSMESTDQMEIIFPASENFQGVLGNEPYEQFNANETAILIVQENGFLKPINLESTELIIEPLTSYDGALEEKITSNEERKKTTDYKINREAILGLLEEAKMVQSQQDYNFEIDRINKDKLKSFGDSLSQHIKTLKYLYGTLEINTESIIGELNGTLTDEELKIACDNLKFIKSIVEKSFATDEKKKLKYKVVSVKLKNISQMQADSTASKPITKRVYGKESKSKRGKEVSNGLLRRTLLRMNKLLDVIEKDRMMLNGRRDAFVSKSKRDAKNESREKIMHEQHKLVDSKNSFDKKKEFVKSNDLEETKIEEKSVLESNDTINHCINVDMKNKLLNVDLRQSKRIAETNMKNNKKNDNKENGNEIKIKRMLNGPSVDVDRKTKLAGLDVKEDCETLSSGQYDELKENSRHSPRYSLRSRKTKSTCLALNYCKEGSTNKTENGLLYEVDYLNVNKMNQTLDYVLKNDNKPCVVLYDKTNVPKTPIFTNSCKPFQKKHLTSSSVKEEVVRKPQTTSRYKTRSKMMEMRVLRSSKI